MHAALPLQVNGGVVALLGYARSELLGSNVRMIVPEPFASNHGTHVPTLPHVHTSHLLHVFTFIIGCVA
jgi:hypothetical protein